MVNYNLPEQSQSFAIDPADRLQVEIGLRDCREALTQISADMQSINHQIDSCYTALDIISNYRGDDAQIIKLINCDHAMENLLNVAESKITVKASEEGLGEALKAIWEKIKQFVKWIIQKVKDFFTWIGKKLGLVKDDMKKTSELAKDPNLDKEKCQQYLQNTAPKGSAGNESLFSKIKEFVSAVYDDGDIEAMGYDTLNGLLKEFELFIEGANSKSFFSYQMEPPQFDTAEIVRGFNENFGGMSDAEIEDAVSKQETELKQRVQKAVQMQASKLKFIQPTYNAETGRVSYDIKLPALQAGSSYAKLGYTADKILYLQKRIEKLVNGAYELTVRLQTVHDAWVKFHQKLTTIKEIPRVMVRCTSRLIHEASDNIKVTTDLLVSISNVCASNNRFCYRVLLHGVPQH